MAKNNKFQEMTTEQLIAYRNKLRGPFIGLGIVMVLAAAWLVYFAITKHQPAFIAVAFGATFSFLPMLVTLGQVNAELKTRNQAGN